jgi:hypothetical protein
MPAEAPKKGVEMINPEIQYALWRFEQRRRDIELERRRRHLQAHQPNPPLDLALVGSTALEASSALETPASCDLGVAS